MILQIIYIKFIIKKKKNKKNKIIKKKYIYIYIYNTRIYFKKYLYQ